MSRMQSRTKVQKIKLTAEMIEGLVTTCLAAHFDSASAIPDFHREIWKIACAENPHVAVIAPRGHSKSTAVTHSYTLAEILFRSSDYVIICSDTEAQAAQFLGDIKKELVDNEDITKLFGRIIFDKDNETDCIGVFEDGKKFRIQAKGAEQKFRGLKWDSKRPNLVVIDDLENDEAVLTIERRTKLKRWFWGVVVPCLSPTGKIRYVGTILHMDSLLENIWQDRPFHISKCKITSTELSEKKEWPQRSNWLCVKYKAHTDDFSHILWEERFDEEFFRSKRQSFISQGLPDMYSQEYLNIPIDESLAYFKRSDIKPMVESDYKKRLRIYAACDLAISEKQTADYSVFVIAGMDEEGMLYIKDVIRERLDGRGLIDTILQIQQHWKPELFTIEAGVIEKSLGAFLKEAMIKRNIFVNVNPMRPDKDKQTRARSIQGRMRAGGVKFDKDAEWFELFEKELLEFPRSRNDDQVDALAWIGLTLDKMYEASTDDEFQEEEYEEKFNGQVYEDVGRSFLTGY